MKRLAFVVFAAVIIAMFAAVLMAHASPVTASPAAVPTLTATEQIALHSMAVENQQLQQQQALLMREINAIESDVKKNHPGFHLDPADPLSGHLMPNAEPAKK